MKQNPAFRFGNATDKGRIRSHNEDYMGYFENQNGIFFVVCDGMGGHAGGAIASQTAVQAIRYFFEQQYYDNIQEAIYQAIQFANTQIYQQALANNALAGMGTTCVLLVLREGKVYYGHVGDSRIYMFLYGRIKRLTRDHSVVQALIDQGLLTEEEAENHPRRNEILRALGTQNFIDVEVAPEAITPQRGDMFLLCSDGLNSLVSDAGIEEILQNNTLDVQHKTLKLIEVANALGGYDNITVQLLEFTQDSRPWEMTAEPEKKKISDTLGMRAGEIALPGELEHDIIRPIPPRRESPIRGRIQELVNVNINTNDENLDFRPLLWKVFSGVVVVILLYALYARLPQQWHILGSSYNLRQDSLRALAIEQQFYNYFWNASPGLRKVKQTIDDTKQTINQIKDQRDSFRNKFKQLFAHREVRNSLKTGEEDLTTLAKRYRSKVDWILKANQVASEDELKQLDSLIIPKEAPPSTDTLKSKPVSPNR